MPHARAQMASAVQAPLGQTSWAIQVLQQLPQRRLFLHAVSHRCCHSQIVLKRVSAKECSHLSLRGDPPCQLMREGSIRVLLVRRLQSLLALHSLAPRGSLTVLVSPARSHPGCQVIWVHFPLVILASFRMSPCQMECQQRWRLREGVRPALSRPGSTPLPLLERV